MGLLKKLAVTFVVAIAACSPASDVSTSGTTSEIATSTTNATQPTLSIGELSACDLAAEDEVTEVIGEATAVTDRIGEATSECRWTTDAGVFEKNEVVVQVSLSSSVSDDMEILRGAMDIVEESGDLGEDSFTASWGDEGIAYVVVSDAYLVTVATDAPAVSAELRSLAETVLSRLP